MEEPNNVNLAKKVAQGEGNIFILPSIPKPKVKPCAHKKHTIILININIY